MATTIRQLQEKINSNISGKTVDLINTNKLNNPLLKRLIEEVKIEDPQMVGGRYDRTHNRHNR